MMVKETTQSQDWVIMDSMRGIPTGMDNSLLFPNLYNAEDNSGSDHISLMSTGFKVTNTHANVNTGGQNYIYMAIRAPQKTPVNSSEVFAVNDQRGTTTNFPVDMAISKNGPSADDNWIGSRIIGENTMKTNSTDAESSGHGVFYNDAWESNTYFPYGFSQDPNYHGNWMWKRAP